VEHGAGLEDALAGVMAKLGRDFDADVGLIAVDRDGHAVANHRTRDMPHAWFEGEGEVISRMRRPR
jgi:isoaspartyl peptidase/L-asparaginase-like protein (Ntn-hydrolase superfamily)